MRLISRLTRLLKRRRKPFPTMEKCLYVSCALEHPNREPAIREVIEAMPDWAKFGDSVMVIGPPMNRMREPWGHMLLAELTQSVKRAGLKLYAGARFWEDSTGGHNWNGFIPKSEDCWNVGLHAAKIVDAKCLADALNADGSVLDAEPYELDLLPYRSVLRPPHPPGDEARERLRLVDESIKAAVVQAGQVDLVYPCHWGYQPAYAWSMGRMGRRRLGHCTYECKNLVLPPAVHASPFEGWGIWATDTPDGKRWTASELLDSFPAGTIQRRYPSVNMLWLYAQDRPRNELAAVMRQLGSLVESRRSP